MFNVCSLICCSLERHGICTMLGSQESNKDKEEWKCIPELERYLLLCLCSDCESKVFDYIPPFEIKHKSSSFNVHEHHTHFNYDING